MHFLHPLLKIGSSKIFKTLINKLIKPCNKQHVIVGLTQEIVYNKICLAKNDIYQKLHPRFQFASSLVFFSFLFFFLHRLHLSL